MWKSVQLNSSAYSSAGVEASIKSALMNALKTIGTQLNLNLEIDSVHCETRGDTVQVSASYWLPASYLTNNIRGGEYRGSVGTWFSTNELDSESVIQSLAESIEEDLKWLRKQFREL